MHFLDVHPIIIVLMHIGWALKSVHITNRISELNRYMMGRVHILSHASTPTFHRCTMETMELHVFFAVVFVWMLMHNDHYRRLEREKQELTRRSQDRERQPISVLVSLSVQPAAILLALSTSITHFDNTPPLYLHVTMLQ